MLMIEVSKPFPYVLPVPSAPPDPLHEALTVGGVKAFDGNLERISDNGGPAVHIREVKITGSMRAPYALALRGAEKH
jgi:hypothetical protein